MSAQIGEDFVLVGRMHFRYASAMPQYTDSPQARDTSLDVLRVTAILFVCLAHAYGAFGGINTVDGWRHDFLQAQLVGVWNMGVNLFMLLTGILYAKREWKVQSYARLMASVVFYVILIVGCWRLCTTGLQPGQWQTVLHECLLPFPFISSYWYFAVYTVVFFLIPYLNKLCRSLDETSYRRLLLILFLLICVAGAFSRERIAGYGYNALWMGCMYLVGAYLKLHPLQIHRRRWFAIAICCSGGMLACAAARHILQEGYWFDVLDAGSYCNPFMAIGSVAVAQIIMKTPVRRPAICRILTLLAPTCFGIYLIQHPVLTETYRDLMSMAAERFHHPIWLPFSFGLAIFIVGFFAETIRGKLFAWCGVNRLIKKAVP